MHKEKARGERRKEDRRLTQTRRPKKNKTSKIEIRGQSTRFSRPSRQSENTKTYCSFVFLQPPKIQSENSSKSLFELLIGQCIAEWIDRRIQVAEKVNTMEHRIGKIPIQFTRFTQRLNGRVNVPETNQNNTFHWTNSTRRDENRLTKVSSKQRKRLNSSSERKKKTEINQRIDETFAFVFLLT